MEEACVLIGLGLLQHQAVRDDLSTVSLTRAFRISASPDHSRQRIYAAEGLMYIARNVGDFDQALALNQEILDWHRTRGDAFELAGAYYARGQIERYRGNHQAALQQFEHARELRVMQNLTQNVAFADMRICGSHLELGNLAAARQHCESALRMFDAGQSPSTRKEAYGMIAAIYLREGQPATALSRLDAVLDRNGDDLLPARVPALFELRAQAHAALGHYREAMRDQATFLRLYKEQMQAERNLQSAVLRAHFETDRQMERNTILQQELALNGGRLRSMIYAAVAGGVILLLLVYLLAANRRQARQLARLADTDALTGLPNRRRTAELVQRMIERAAREGTAVTIAIIDIDHFKSINDRFGHATGDRVLREFARNARDSLREGDLIGRWGGEEFLAALPDTELDVASKVMERVRAKLDCMPDHADSPGLSIRVSVGLATSGQDGHGLDHIVAQADIALYQAKHAGRDTLRIAQQSYDAAPTSVRKALHGAGMSMTTGRFRRLAPDAELERAG
jgi:diguanylate cyclase (GGDEF)-like protein